MKRAFCTGWPVRDGAAPCYAGISERASERTLVIRAAKYFSLSWLVVCVPSERFPPSSLRNVVEKMKGCWQQTNEQRAPESGTASEYTWHTRRVVSTLVEKRNEMYYSKSSGS